jgi:hypothetical protein
MNKVFCSACGHKNLYEVSQPKFCAGCGAGMGVKASVSGVDKVLRPQMDVSIESDDSNVVGSFDLNKMRNQIYAETNSNAVKLSDLMGSSNSTDDGYSRDEVNLPDGDALLQRSEQDCGSSKPSDIDG